MSVTGEQVQEKDLLSIANLSSQDIQLLVSNAMDIKVKGSHSMLDRKVLALVFEKPSLRTRVSFEMAMRQLGGQCLYISPSEVGLGGRESVPDVARVLSRYVDCIAARTFSHQSLEVLASYSRVPVINALSDQEHPCQALTDLLTIYEKKGDFRDLTLAYIGDGNNVANSLLLASVLVGIDCRIATPSGYNISGEIMGLAQNYAADSGSEILCTDEPYEAVNGADIVYTDVWTSMGQEEESEKRRQLFASYQINSELMAIADEDAIFMHPLPAHRGEEVTDDVVDSPQSVVFDQAENRMHLAKAVLAEILGGLEIPLAGFS
jgi:ornithine carbamoyltransferase